MAKKIFSLLIAILLLATVGVYASSTMDVVNFTDKMVGNSYSFSLEYEIKSGLEGDRFELQLPFDVDINGGQYFEVHRMGVGRYELVLLDDYINISGYIKGKKTIISNDKLNPIIIDGNTIKDDYPLIEEGTGESTERDRFYKIGNIEGNTIYWEVAIGGDEKEVHATSITDELGDGHILNKDSIRFEVIEHGQYNNDLVDMIVKNLEVTDTEIHFDIDTISPGEVLYLTYSTTITDPKQLEFSNQLIIEGEKKISQSVEIESDSEVNGEQPSNPDIPPTLPQVGESIFKVEYLIAGILLSIATFIRKRV